MTKEESIRLRELLREIRGTKSIRSFCMDIPIHRAAWGTWESLDSAPQLENLEEIAKLKGWNIEQITAYLRTGDIANPAYNKEELLKYGKSLPFEERAELARQLLEP